MGLFGSSSNQGALDAEAVNLLKGVETPDIESMKLQLQQLVEQGQLSPEEAETYFQSQSEMNGITLDPRLKNAQMDALGSLQEIGQNNGLTSNDRSQLNQIQTEEDTRARGSREAILQNAQARGAGGSGLEMLDQMTNAQNSATRSSQRGFDVAAQAQDRALQSLQSAGTLGGQIQGQEFGQQAQVAQGQDAINRFNTANQQSQQNLNVGARNTAQAGNLAAKQGIANQNVDLANKQQQFNKQLNQQDFQNQMAKNQAVAGALNKSGTNAQAAQDNDDAFKRQLIGAGITGIGAAFSDKNLKENVSPFNASEFLDNLTPSKYSYKDPKHGEGKQVGVMAQDVQKEAPQMVEDTSEGKVIDYNKAGGPLFASLAHLHERLKKIEGRA